MSVIIRRKLKEPSGQGATALLLRWVPYLSYYAITTVMHDTEQRNAFANAAD